MTDQTDNGKDSSKGAGRDLDDLIRMAGELPEDNEFVRPDEETIQAYLSDTASDQQVELVENALLMSQAFRLELRQIARDLEAFTSEETISQAAAYQPESIPDLSAYLKTTQEPITIIERLRDYLNIRVLVPVAAAAVIVLAFLIPHWQTAPQFARAELQPAGEMNLGRFMGKSMRGALDRDTIPPAASAEEAARAEFSRMIKFKDGDFLFEEHAVETPSDAGGVSTMVQLVDPAQDWSHSVTAQVPVAVIDLSTGVEFWVLTLPDRKLSRLSMTADAVETPTAYSPEKTYCCLVTYPVENGYRATPALFFTGQDTP